ncbi:MAG: S41 family peptidase [Dehalococcoidia bacterium]|nr:MAG: S41 family peptidase [Dehalococcoidia bacterium]
MGKTSRVTLLILVLVAVVIIYLIGIPGSPWYDESPDEPEFDLVEEAWRVIISDYVDIEDVDLERLSEGAIRGMIEALDDPYSGYFDAEQYELSQYSLEGSFGGIGVEITVNKEGELTVIAPIAGTPAKKEGILPGDRILGINGTPTKGMNLVDAVLRIRGEPGTDVRLNVLHEGNDTPEEIVITREEIDIETVLPKMIPGNIAHIEINHFSSRTQSEIVSALEDMALSEMSGIILDLRNNPGGVLKSAVSVASQFLDRETRDEDVVVYVVDAEGNEEAWEVEDGGLATDVPLVVLVNGNSASSSEVVAGALQDYGRAKIIGTHTLGKGAVNHFRQLSDGSAIYITSARWFTPDRHQIEGQGILPDETIEITTDDVEQGLDPQLERAIEYLQNIS